MKGNKVRRLMIALDRFLSPPKNFVNVTYRDRLHSFAQNLKTGKNVPRNLVHFVRLSFMLGLSGLLSPLSRLLKKNGYRFVDIDLSQIGSALYLDLLLREDRLTRQTPQRKMFILASYYEDGNRYLFDLYRNYGVFIRNPLLKFLLSPFFMSDIFQDNSYRYDTVFFPKAVSHDIWNRYQDKFKSPLINFPPEDIAKARSILSRYIPEHQKFVTLHVRDNGFYASKTPSPRNADILTYEKGIRYLIEQGYAVIRLGDPTADRIDSMLETCGPMLFDYAHSDIKSEMMDCFLLSQCAFFVGGPSGPASVPFLFGTRSCNVNWYTFANAPNFLEGDLTSCKQFYCKADHSPVPFKALMAPPMSINPTAASLDEKGLYYRDNSPDEILETLKEFIQTPPGHASVLQKEAQSYLNEKTYAFGAKGHFSEVTLKPYEREILVTPQAARSQT